MGKIRIGISSCLLGNNVRYDGGNKREDRLIELLGSLVEWVPLCPEAESGLPVPRAAMQLVLEQGGLRLKTITTGIDQTERLVRWTEEKLATMARGKLAGFVFKARSPSCALRDAVILCPGGEVRQGAGVFASAFRARFPDIPIRDEESLRDSTAIQEFYAQAESGASDLKL